MAEEIKKEAKIKLDSEPRLKPISNTGVGFYNLDINTAALTFRVTKKGKPILISENNAQGYAYFKSDNGSVSGVLDLDYKDPMNGIVSITLPTDFLQASTGSTVTGQMYITVNKWTDTPTDKSDTAVLTEFSFTVKDALINSISGETKIEYIRMFDKLKDQIQDRVDEIEEALKNGDDFVTEMKNTLESGKKELNDTVVRNQEKVEKTASNAISDVTTARNNAVKTLEEKSSDAINQVESAKKEALEAVSDTNDRLDNLNAYTKKEVDKKISSKADASELEKKADKNELNDKADNEQINDLRKRIRNYYDNLFETEVLYDGLEEDIGIYFDEKKTFTIDQNKTVEKLIFWWSRNEINEGARNYAFETTIVDGQTLRTLQKKESTMRVPFKPTETDTTSFKNIDFIKEGVKGSEKNRQSNIGERDNRWMALRKFYVIYRKEVG